MMKHYSSHVLLLAAALLGAVSAFEKHSLIRACHDNETDEVKRQIMEDPGRCLNINFLSFSAFP